ncbi:PAN/Apple domain-containing protein [Hyphomonas sp.]|uniref:PAN/Apple domain-containing protein n=1 Tax=Hyphomonas sp. TaxID=87 RepID=UPI00352931D2
MRLVPLIAFALLAAPAFADTPSMKPDKPAKGQEAGVYRFGSTYSVSPAENASACQSICAEDDKCVAWSYIATYEGADARCELKQGGGKARPNPLATSGVSPTLAAKFIPEPKPELEGGPEGE